MSDDLLIDWGHQTLIPPGVYQAVYVNHETTKGSWGLKVKIVFRITEIGTYFDTLIEGWYNVNALKSKPGKNKKVILSRHCKLTTELLKVLGIKERLSRISPTHLRGKLLEISVRTVKTNSRQKEYASIQQYSVVESINKLLTDDLCVSHKPLPKPIPEPIPTKKYVESSGVMDSGHLMAKD
jgi:hypothetical protein